VKGELSEPPTWVPERLVGVATATRTAPLVVECSHELPDGTIDRATFVVKARGVPNVDDLSTFREFAGSLLASALSIDVAEPAFIDVDDVFVAAVAPLPVVASRPIKAGRCFGCRHLGTGLDVPGPATVYDEELRMSAARLFGFDLAFQNSDRLPENPNCVLARGRVVAFDFERAFEFLWRGGKPAPATEPAQLWVAKRHVLRPALRKDRAPLLEFASDLQKFDVRMLLSATEWMPASWHLPLKKIATHIEAIHAGIDTFRDSLVSAAA
jgi:hypothetical protein